VKYNKEGSELDRWSYAHNGSTLTPSGIAPAGNGTFIVLFPEANIAALFKPE
jgi:hypothetical protein